jgi:lysophospholipase L1-like esterase
MWAVLFVAVPDVYAGFWQKARGEVPCGDIPRERLMVAVAFGQSNSANFGNTPRRAGPGVYSFYEGRCFRAADPMPGAGGGGGSVWTRLGDEILKSGLYSNVLFASIGVGGTSVSQWRPGGILHNKILATVEQLRKHRLEPTHMLWHQGEADMRRRTNTRQYREMFLEMLGGIRAGGIDAPVYVSVATRMGQKTSPEIQKAQRGLVDVSRNILPGPDTDKLGFQYRYDGVHFSDEGMEVYSAMWLKCLRAR